MINFKLPIFTGACFFIAVSIAFSGCSSEVFSTVEDYRSVMTIRIDDTYYKFNTLQTYQLVVRENTDGDAELLELHQPDETKVKVDHANDAAILDELEIQLQARGLQNVVDLADAETGDIPTADVIVFAQLIAQPIWDYTGAVKLTDLDDLPALAVRYPGPPVDVSYDAESVVITMIDTHVTVVDHPAQYYAIWTAGIHGVHTDTSRATLRSGIRKAFKQSPYIKAAGPPPGGVE